MSVEIMESPRIDMKNYKIDEFGVIHQIDKKPFTYDKEYITDYNEFKELTTRMAHLRLGYLIGAIGFKPEKVIDFGYGNGDFLTAANNYGIDSYGTDISGYDVPEGCTFVRADHLNHQHYDVVCFFDSLEHVDDMSLIENLDTDYVLISLPWCHFEEKGEKWFDSWKHRKEDEHLHHFNKDSLEKYFKRHGYSLVTHSNIEDTIRKPINEDKNILSAVFKKDIIKHVEAK